jgi:aquaporin TIP
LRPLPAPGRAGVRARARVFATAGRAPRCGDGGELDSHPLVAAPRAERALCCRPRPVLRCADVSVCVRQAARYAASMSRAEEKSELLVQRAGSRSEAAGAAVGDLEVQDTIDDDIDLVRALFAEFAGSLFLIFVGLGSVYGTAVITLDEVKADRSLYIALAYASAFACAMYMLSFPAADRRLMPNMRHLNPAVTFGLVASFKIHIGRAILYWMAQVTGAGVGVLFIYWFTPVEKRDILTAYPVLDSANFFHKFSMEIVVSFVSVLAALITFFGHLSKQPSIVSQLRETSPLTPHEINCLIIFGIIFGCNLCAGPVSGGYMNPLFALGIGMLSNDYDVPALVAPFVGAIIAVVTGLIFGFRVKLMYFKDRK